MTKQRTICVYCGSSVGARPVYLAAARALGRKIAQAGLRTVYGGAHVGLMGAVADAALAAGGEVIGVIPRDMIDRELAHRGLTELHIVVTMHERKQKMADFADAFIALPGGYGTLDELCEVLGWTQLGIHNKPIVLLDIENYWEPLFHMFDQAAAEGFLKMDSRARARRACSVEEALAIFQEQWTSVLQA